MQSRAGSKKNLYHPVTNLEVALSSPFFKVDIEAYFHWICSTESIVSHRFMVKTQKKKFRKLKLNYAYCNVHTWRFLTFWLEFQESSRHEMTNKTETLIYCQFWSEARTHSGPHNIMEGKLKRLNERSKVTCRTAKSDYLQSWIAKINKKTSTNWIKIYFFLLY